MIRIGSWLEPCDWLILLGQTGSSWVWVQCGPYKVLIHLHLCNIFSLGRKSSMMLNQIKFKVQDQTIVPKWKIFKPKPIIRMSRKLNLFNILYSIIFIQSWIFSYGQGNGWLMSITSAHVGACVLSGDGKVLPWIRFSRNDFITMS